MHSGGRSQTVANRPARRQRRRLRETEWYHWRSRQGFGKQGALSAIVTLDETFHRQSCVIILGNRNNVGRLLMYSDARK